MVRRCQVGRVDRVEDNLVLLGKLRDLLIDAILHYFTVSQSVSQFYEFSSLVLWVYLCSSGALRFFSLLLLNFGPNLNTLILSEFLDQFFQLD